MNDDYTPQRFARFLGSAGRAHHQAVGGANQAWSEWYAQFLHAGIAEYVEPKPSVEELAEWLRAAEERHRNEAPDDPWPPFYAKVILEEHGS